MNTYIIFNVSELDKIDFEQVLETSIDTVRKSIDGVKTFVTWDGDIDPACVLSLTTRTSYLTYDEILAILETPEWSSTFEFV